MIKILPLVVLLFCLSSLTAQDKRFSLEANYGLNGNFYANSFDELGGPVNKKYFYNKNFLGSVGGLELSYRVGKKSALIGGYSRSQNSGRKNFSGVVQNLGFIVYNFRIQQSNNIYYLGYKYNSVKWKNRYSFDVGPVLMYAVDQSIRIEEWANYISVEESNFKVSNSVEGGVFLGFQFSHKIDNHFNLGLKFRTYYLISVASLEMMSLTPTLAYQF